MEHDSDDGVAKNLIDVLQRILDAGDDVSDELKSDLERAFSPSSLISSFKTSG